ncbi:sensor histidine kinase [Salinispirillum marinum]|uniref:Sensor histidine kinase n=2 Tax=Saccharospirillaceae TaxID=255527 RepID=A0ABV8BHZ0_9GAMM
MLTVPSFIDKGWKNIVKAIGQCLLLCLVIALVITPFNGTPFLLNVWISAGFGLSIIFFINFIYRVNPRGRDLLNNSIAMALGFALGMLNLLLVMALYYPQAFESFDMALWLTNTLFSFIVSIAAFYFFYSMYRMQSLRLAVSEQQARAAERERQMVQSQLQLLQSQIEPHFLFNTLANIQALIDAEPEQAKHMVAALTHMLRANLQRTRSTETTLREEFELVQHYLDIQAIRMGARLTFALTLPDALKAVKVPPLLLQPLVENALLHGIEPNVEPGHIAVQAIQEGEGVILRVVDNGVGLTATDSTGIGLTNIRERLASLYGAQATLTVRPVVQGQGVLAEIRIPHHGA